MVKAASRWRGRGMRLVDEKEGLEAAISTARSEAENAFGSGELILEKAIVKPRHVEIQVFADITAMSFIWASAIARCNAAIKKSLKKEACPNDARLVAMGERRGCRQVDQFAGAGTVGFY